MACGKTIVVDGVTYQAVEKKPQIEGGTLITKITSATIRWKPLMEGSDYLKIGIGDSIQFTSKDSQNFLKTDLFELLAKLQELASQMKR